jgi:hypothetical protein
MRGVSRYRDATADGRVRAAGWLLLLLLSLVVLLASSGTAAAAGTQALGEENDTEPPEWTNATKAGPTEIELTFTDTSTIDQTSISADDFTLSSGTVSNVTVDVTRDGATVTLLLEERLNVDTVTVGFADSGGVADEAGNELSTGTTTVSDMDTRVPTVESFRLTRVDASTAELRVSVNEPLTSLRVAVTGPAERQLTMANFTAVDGTNTTFRTRYTVPEYGSYSFIWERAVDRYGNRRVLSRMRQFRYDDSAPEIVLDGPETTTVDTAVNFSAAETVDEDGIDSYQWRIDGGTLLSGPSIQVAFATAGSHDITLEVTDSEGNTAVDTRRLTVRATADDPSAVSVTSVNATDATATVEGTGLVQQVRAENGSLVEGNAVTLDRLSAVFPASRTVSLDVRAASGSPASFEGPSLGLFEVDHSAAANRASLRFSVNRSALNDAGVAPDEVVLYRDAGGWTPLPTSVVDRAPQRVTYQATAPGLSQFAVGAQSGSETTGQRTGVREQNAGSQSSNRPDITVTNVTVDAVALSAGDTAVINVTAVNRGSADGSYPFSVRLDGTSVATHEISVPAGDTRTQRYEQTLTAEGALVVAGTPVANVSSEGGGGSLLPGSVADRLSGLPNPLALWPGGLVGTILGALVGLVVVVYSVLKALAIYLGY